MEIEHERKYYDIAPEENGTQISLSCGLKEKELKALDSLANVEYNNDGTINEPDNVFINCNVEDKAMVLNYLKLLGFKG